MTKDSENDGNNHEMILKKGHEFVHISNQINITQRKLLNVLLYNAYDSLLTQEIHSVSIPMLVELMGYDSNNYDFLKEAFRKLVDLKFEWNILGDKGETWGIATALAQAEIENNICKYSYAPKVREKMFNPEIYAAIDLRIQGKFKSNYALAVYENCLRFRGQKKTIWISLPILRQLLGIPETIVEFKILNRDILKPAVATVNEISNIEVETELQRENRKVVAVRFLIKEKYQSLPDLTSAGIELDPKLINKLMEFGLSEKHAKTEATLRTEEYITNVLNYVENKVKSGKVKDVPAYTVRALKEGWMDIETKFSRNKKALEEYKEQAIKYDAELNVLKAAFSDFRKSRVANVRNKLTQDELDELSTEFVAGLQPHERDMYKRNGFDSAIIQNIFNKFITDRYLTKPEEVNFEEFVKYSNFNMPLMPTPPKKVQ